MEFRDAEIDLVMMLQRYGNIDSQLERVDHIRLAIEARAGDNLYQNGVVKTTFKQMKRFLERRRDGYLTDRSTQQNIRMELARLGNLAAFDNATQRQNRKDEP